MERIWITRFKRIGLNAFSYMCDILWAKQSKRKTERFHMFVDGNIWVSDYSDVDELRKNARKAIGLSEALSTMCLL